MRMDSNNRKTPRSTGVHRIICQKAYAAEFLVTIEGADKATTLYYSQTGVWFDEQGELYKVVAWMPLPEVFRG